MILAIFENLSRIESLLNNLSEADFNLNDVSVIYADVKQRDVVAKDLGPLKGIAPKKLVEELTKLGVSRQNAELCQEAVLKGKVLSAMNISPELSQAAEEMFRDQSAQIIKG